METRLLSILCILMMSLGIQAHDLEPLHVDGRYLKNSKGDIVTLHGFEQTYDPYEDPGFVHWIRGDWEACLRYKQTAVDSMLAVGWKFDYVRLMIINPSELEYTHLGSYKKYFEELMIPMIDFYHSRNIYTLLWGIAPGEARHFEMGDDFQQQSLLFWDYVSNHPHIKNNPGVMFELFNEPDEPSEKYDDPGKAWTDYVQPLVDKIRSHADNVIFVPMIPQARNGFAEYPLKGDNIGYQLHFYPGWDFGQGIENNWDKDGGQLFLSNTAPLILTETSWDEKIDLLGVGNTTTFGRPLKDVIDKYGNVSWNPYAVNEIAYIWVRRPSEIGKLTWWDDPDVWVEQIPVDSWFHYDPEVCLIPLFDWFGEYQKTNKIPASQFKAITVKPELVPTQMEQGDFYAMRIMAGFTNGLNWNIAGDAIYTVSDPSVLAINHGNIRALQEGLADITATYTDGTGQTFNCQFQIVVTPATDTKTNQVFADSKAIWYGDETPALTYTTLNPNLSGTPQLSTTATSTSSVGIYPITINNGTMADQQVNYVDGEFCILPAPLTVGVQDVTITEGDAIPSFTLTYSGFRNDDTEANAFTTKPTATTTATSSSAPGTYPITVSGGEAKNYTLNYQIGTLTILEDENPTSYRTYPLTLDIFYEWDGCTATSKIVNSDCQGEIHVGEKLSAGELIYGDMAVYYTHYADVTKYNQLIIEGTPGMELRVLLNRLEIGNGGGDDHGGGWTELNPVIGDDGKAIVDLSDYEFVHLNAIKTGWGSPEGVIKSLYLARGKIEQPVTITANDLTMVYGDDMPTLTYSSEGGELNGTPKLSTTATKKSAVGTYPIKVEKGTVTNEKVTYVEGTLTIVKAPLTVGVVDVTITEGDDIPTFTLTYSGFRNNDYANRAFTTKPTATTTATSNSVAGTYPITISGGEAKNYEPTYKPGTLTIEPAAGIESVYADGQGNGVIYNVNGQKLSKPKKGINIIGGKKIVVKKDQTP